MIFCKRKSICRVILFAEKILTFTANELKGVTLVYNAQTLLLKKNGSSWEMEEPYKSPADTTRVSTSIDKLMDWKSTRTLLDEIKASELEAFGFKNPVLTIIPAWDKPRDPKEILVGKKTPTNSGYYVMPKPGIKVYLAENFIIDDLTRLVTDPPKPTPAPAPTGSVPTLLNASGSPAAGSPTPQKGLHKPGSGGGGGTGGGGDNN